MPAVGQVGPPAPAAVDPVNYFAERPAAPKRKPQPKIQYSNWAMYDVGPRSAVPPPHLLAMNPYRERSPMYVYMFGLEHPYLGDVSNQSEAAGPPQNFPRAFPPAAFEFTGE